MNTRPDAMDWMMAAICVGGVLLTWLGLAVVIGMMINLARAIVMVALNWIDARAEREEMKARRARSVRREGKTRCERVGEQMAPATSGAKAPAPRVRLEGASHPSGTGGGSCPFGAAIAPGYSLSALRAARRDAGSGVAAAFASPEARLGRIIEVRA